jgi:CRP-like cAMP-binding protein
LFAELCSDPRRATRNSILLEPTARATALLRISEGWAIRYCLLADGRRQILSILLPGDFVGLEALVMRPMAYSVQATTEVAYQIMDAQQVFGLISQDPQRCREILQVLWSERTALDDWLTCVAACNAEQRIAFLFIDLYERLTALRLMMGNSFAIGLTQQQMADALGLNLIHFNRVLRRLKTKALLTISDREIVLHDLAGLRSLLPLQPRTHSQPNRVPRAAV